MKLSLDYVIVGRKWKTSASHVAAMNSHRSCAISSHYEGILEEYLAAVFPASVVV